MSRVGEVDTNILFVNIYYPYILQQFCNWSIYKEIHTFLNKLQPSYLNYNIFSPK